MIGESDEDEDFHGFTEKEIQFANLKSEYLQAQTEQQRQAYWLAKGVALDPEDREEIFKSSGASTYRKKPLWMSNENFFIKKKVPIKEPAPASSCHTKPKTQKRDSSGKCIKSNFKQAASMTHEEISQMHFEENLRKPKSEIQIPGWRRIVSPCKVQSNIEVSDQEELEDMSDDTFIIRHKKAEEEEQQLWEKWQAKRLEDGKAITGRSKSSGWREADLGLDSPRLRSQRVSSIKSECSTPGRLSPATVERVKEIYIEPSTPPFSIKSLHKAFDKSDSGHQKLKEPSKLSEKFSNKLISQKSSAQRILKTKNEQKNRSSTGNKVKEAAKETNNVISGRKEAEKSLLEKSKDIEMSSAKENDNVVKADLPNVRRSKSDTVGMRRSSPRDEKVADPNVLKSSKENIACQLINLDVSSPKELKKSTNSTSESSNSTDNLNRVLKDSNVEKGILSLQTSRQATKKTILSQKSVHRNCYTYPLRSQAISRRTRQGVKR